MSRNVMKSVVVSLLIATAWPLLPAPLAQAEKPNIIFIMADDMGYGDVQALNPNSTIPTPNLNRLAREGMTFADAHTPSAVCTPTRYGVVTGRYCWRSPLKRGVLNGYGRPLIEPDRPTVASFLKGQGYACGVVGKWHLGLGFARSEVAGEQLDLTKPVEGGPNVLGFDHAFVIPASLDFPPYVYVRNGRVTEPETVDQPGQSFPAYLRQGPRSTELVMEDVLDRLADEATDFIRRQAESPEPFFLYFPLSAPHKPVLPHPRFRGKTKLGPYGDFVVQVDATVGRVLATLDECKLTENTLIMYSSDNGSFMFRLDDPQATDHTDDATVQAYRAGSHTSNGQLRGTKTDIWEGGHRVPFFARWPGKIAPGSRCDETICLTDLFATVADVVGVRPAEGAAEDSFSFLPLAMGKPRPTARPPVIHHSGIGMFAIRRGPWKLVLGDGSGGREMPRGKVFGRPYQLFDLSGDPREREDLIETRGDVAEELEKASKALGVGG